MGCGWQIWTDNSPLREYCSDILSLETVCKLLPLRGRWHLGDQRCTRWHKGESIMHPEMQCYYLPKSEAILQLDDCVFKPPCPKRKHFLQWVQLWYIPMQMKPFSLFLYEKSPISSPSLNLSPNKLDKKRHLQLFFFSTDPRKGHIHP